MSFKSIKSFLVAAFSVSLLFFSTHTIAQEKQPSAPEDNKQQVTKPKKGFDANEVIFGHVLDAHEFHFLSYKDKDGLEHNASIPLPVILYSPQKGFSTFMSSAFHEGEEEVDGYKLVNGKILPVDEGITVYDLSLTRNVVQMLLSLIILVWLMIGISNKYKKGTGVTTAPSGFQNAVEPVITFVRDEVAVPNLGLKANKYMPFLLTVFFFILINNIIGLIPGTANVTGNIAFTIILGLISFVVILLSTNANYWKHIFWPPVPLGVKFIMIPVEILGIFTKPFALIIRLFANMIAGHIIIICLISLIFIFGALNIGVGWGFSPISVGFTIFIYFIEILVAFLQAFIFTNLTAVFIGQATEDAHHHEGGEHVKGYDDPVMV